MLTDLTQAHRESLRACGEFRHFEKGQKLLTQGARSSNLLIVLEGEVELSRETPYGDFVLNRVAKESLLGDVLYCCQQPRATDAIALTDGELLVAKPKALQLAFSGHDGFEVAMLWQFWRSLSEKLRHVNAALEVFFRTERLEPRNLRATPQRLSRFDVNQRRQVFRRLGLSNMEVNFLASVAQACELSPDECLFRQGDDADCLYVVAEGRLMVSKEIPGAGTEALAFVEPGQIVGEMGVIDEQARTADAFTMASTTTLLRLQPDTLAKVLHPEKTTSVRLLRYLCHQQALRVHATYEKIIGWFLLSGGQTG